VSLTISFTTITIVPSAIRMRFPALTLLHKFAYDRTMRVSVSFLYPSNSVYLSPTAVQYAEARRKLRPKSENLQGKEAANTQTGTQGVRVQYYDWGVRRGRRQR
jgi:hypothetical protein